MAAATSWQEWSMPPPDQGEGMVGDAAVSGSTIWRKGTCLIYFLQWNRSSDGTADLSWRKCWRQGIVFMTIVRH
ncbi:unnamed protein product [Calypogeia fissa]